jgi:hypothetical protein
MLNLFTSSLHGLNLRVLKSRIRPMSSGPFFKSRWVCPKEELQLLQKHITKPPQKVVHKRLWLFIIGFLKLYINTKQAILEKLI